jgi:transposase-like protein
LFDAIGDRQPSDEQPADGQPAEREIEESPDEQPAEDPPSLYARREEPGDDVLVDPESSPPAFLQEGAEDDRQAPDADRWRPATERPEWQEPLVSGEVQRIGLGIIDERAKQFTPEERRIADHLARPGAAVVAVAERYGAQGRTPDAFVDGVQTEFKSLDPGANHRTVQAALNSAKGQADNAVIDARNSGLSEAEADRGLRLVRCSFRR